MDLWGPGEGLWGPGGPLGAGGGPLGARGEPLGVWGPFGSLGGPLRTGASFGVEVGGLEPFGFGVGGLEPFGVGVVGSHNTVQMELVYYNDHRVSPLNSLLKSLQKSYFIMSLTVSSK